MHFQKDFTGWRGQDISMSRDHLWQPASFFVAVSPFMRLDSYQRRE
jgi:hypothetical protein